VLGEWGPRRQRPGPLLRGQREWEMHLRQTPERLQPKRRRLHRRRKGHPQLKFLLWNRRRESLRQRKPHLLLCLPVMHPPVMHPPEKPRRRELHRLAKLPLRNHRRIDLLACFWMLAPRPVF